MNRHDRPDPIPQRDRPLVIPTSSRRIGPDPRLDRTLDRQISTATRRIGPAGIVRAIATENRRIGRTCEPDVVPYADSGSPNLPEENP
jgi:hypothetical protein